MKNLTIKKVALGLFLAGYAASGAFALDATTDQVINGTKPVLRAPSTGNDHALDVIISTDPAGNTSIGNRAAQTGDFVVIKYDLFDADGDQDNGTVRDTLLVSIQKNGTWQSVTPTITATGAGYISFLIDSNFVGADKIGFRILERTEFGLPYYNQWIGVNDIWANAAPVATDANGSNPGDAPGGAPDPNNPNLNADPTNGDSSPHGPGGNAAPGFGPITSTTARVGIFKVVNGTVDKAVNYDQNTSVDPLKYGDTFQAIVWDDANSDSVLDANETELSGYTFVWTLDGTYEGVTASVADNLGTADTITLATTNSMYTRTDGGDAYKAGAQGFKLKVTAN
ncbi:hypothetical protein GQ597_00160 [Gilliamella sp. Pra-s65]|uniref:hypothetical protein n=1 Tax=unclassified Gilliamella TaxID=2685620 RepID=UPI0013658B57|nr:MULTISPECIES: hypothetical protein [unclassified Gilliamella]MWN89137.1 hypothetical protein [Gilliamella sp. Pra-s65]MWP47195.1 hypothetical protein [Gilliamella sp. Pas-s27]MWP72180.1 hypothetical protein [Gilliamella sp. Pra-s52]